MARQGASADLRNRTQDPDRRSTPAPHLAVHHLDPPGGPAMKKLLFLALVVAGGIVGYSYFLNAPPASADERVLADLEHQFDSANQSMMQASRATGVSGMDSTADI